MDLPGHFVMPEAHASPGLARDGTEATGVFNQDATLRMGKGGHVERRGAGGTEGTLLSRLCAKCRLYAASLLEYS